MSSALKRCSTAVPPSAGAPSDRLKRLVRLGSERSRRDFRITLFGAAKTGKSSLLNGLIGADLLATRAFRTHRAVTEVCFGTTPRVEVVYHDGTAEALDFDMVRVPLNEMLEPEITGERIKVINVAVPLPLLERGIVLVDTPGLLTDTGLDTAAHEEILRSDLAVMVLAADKILSAEERAVAAWVNGILHGRHRLHRQQDGPDRR